MPARSDCLPLVISDRLTAAGFRLAGLATQVATAQTVRALFHAATQRDQPILLTADLAEQLPPDQLAAVIRRARPPVAVIPDVSGHGQSADLSARVRSALGVES